MIKLDYDNLLCCNAKIPRLLEEYAANKIDIMPLAKKGICYKLAETLIEYNDKTNFISDISYKCDDKENIKTLEARIVVMNEKDFKEIMDKLEMLENQIFINDFIDFYKDK